MKHNPSGKVILSKKINNPQNLRLNSSNRSGLYINGSCYFLMSTQSPNFEHMILKVDSNLNPTWCKKFINSGSVAGISVYKIEYFDGRIYVGGRNMNGQIAQLTSIDTNGSVIWSKSYEKGTYSANSIEGVTSLSNSSKLIAYGLDVDRSSGVRVYPTLLKTDTSKTLNKCENHLSMSVSNFNVSSTLIQNPTSINIFKSRNQTISSNNVAIVDNNICPWEQKDTTICIGDSVLISNRYQRIQGIYPDTLTSSFGCDSIVMRNLIVSNIRIPRVSLGDDRSLCQGDSLVLKNIHLTNARKQWHDGSTLDSLVVHGPGEYWLMEKNGCGEARDTIIININQESPLKIDLGKDTSICMGDSIVLINNGPSTRDKLWQNGSNADTLVVKNAGEFWLMEQNNCDEFYDTIQITLKPIPQVELGNDTTLCDGDQITLQNKISSTLDKQWYDGSNTVNYVVNSSGEFWLMERNDCGEARDTISIGLEPDPSISLGNDTSICEDKQIRLTARTNGTQIVWDDQSNELTRDINQEGIYWVKSTSLKGCENSDTIEITLTNCDEFELEMPNVFTPNKDPLNKVFIPIKFKGIKTAHLQIFNRWGEKLFETHDVKKGWNGLDKGKPVPEGVYFWILEYKKSHIDNPETLLLSGSVTIIK